MSKKYKGSTSVKSYSYYDDREDDYGDYYGGYYGNRGGKKRYSSFDDDWNWRGYSSWKQEEGENLTLFVKPHSNYSTPSSWDFKFKLDYQYQTDNYCDTIKEFSRYFYYRMLGSKDYINDTYGKDDEDSKREFYESLWNKFIPGYTPLEQALSVFMELSSKKEHKYKDLRGKKQEEEELELDADDVDFNEEFYTDQDMSDLIENQPEAKNMKIELLKKLSMIQRLGGEFKIEKEIEEKAAEFSRISVRKPMKEYSQILGVDFYQRLLPNFDTRFITKNLVINTPVTKTEHKQQIVLLVDHSGSMDSKEKQLWVIAVLIDRLKYVMKGQAEVYFGFFNHRHGQFPYYHLHDRESVMNFWKNGFTTKPRGGDTAVGEVATSIYRDIIDNKKMSNIDVDFKPEDIPEFLIINDRLTSQKS